MRTMKCDTCEDQPYNHSRCRNQHDPPPPNRVDPFQCNQREQKVGSGDDESNGSRLIKPDFSKQGGGVIHQRVETAELLKGLHATTDGQRTSVDRVREHGLGAVVESGGLGNADGTLHSCVENSDLETSPREMERQVMSFLDRCFFYIYKRDGERKEGDTLRSMSSGLA